MNHRMARDKAVTGDGKANKAQNTSEAGNKKGTRAFIFPAVFPVRFLTDNRLVWSSGLRCDRPGDPVQPLAHLIEPLGNTNCSKISHIIGSSTLVAVRAEIT